MNEEQSNVDVVTEEEVKTYTQDEVMQLLQSEADKRVDAALKKQAKKYEKQLSLSGLDEQQREQAQKDIRIQELEEKLKEFNVMQTKAEVTKVLNARGLSSQFADLIEIGEDVEEAQQRIDMLDKLFKQAVKTEVEKRISTTAPKTGTCKTEGLTKEDFNKMTLAQQSELYNENKELYLALCK